MSAERRTDLIKKLETEFNGRVLVIVTGDRPGMETRIASDILPLISEHLNRIGPQNRLALFLYTPGGDIIAGWGLVNLLAQYCQEFITLVPFRALSCGTLIALGANRIVMGRHGLLSPVDPSVQSPFNPTIPVGGQPQLLPVSVEDLIGYLDLARKEAAINKEQMVDILRILAEKVHPLALGAVYRAREQSANLARRLLKRHLKDDTLISKIVKTLTEELPTHSYLIGRREASKDIGIPVEDANSKTDALMWDLYKEYENWLKLTQPVSAEIDLGNNPQANVKYYRAVVESVEGTNLHQHIFMSDVIWLRVRNAAPGVQGPVDQVGRRNLYEGWLAAQNDAVVS